jgi:hypothetical protein
LLRVVPSTARGSTWSVLLHLADHSLTPRIVFFKTQKAAALCAQAVIHAEDNREFTVSE